MINYEACVFFLNGLRCPPGLLWFQQEMLVPEVAPTPQRLVIASPVRPDCCLLMVNSLPGLKAPPARLAKTLQSEIDIKS